MRTTRATQTPVLVLNASYEPVNICGARRALVLLYKGDVFVEEAHDRLVHSDIHLPSVIRLKHYRRVPQRRHTVSRKHIYTRDRYTCQYCGEVFGRDELTLDHVLPVSRGGKNTWENLVSCCERCNHKKADRTPEEAEMPLLHRPLPMTLHTGRHIMRALGAEDPRWRKYLYY
jgi:5-methylcytosine-specific restriction endonuclease McrA